MDYRDVVNKINNNKQNYDANKIREDFQEFVELTQKIKTENDDCKDQEELEMLVRSRINSCTNNLLEPNMSLVYMDKTLDYIIENPQIIDEVIEQKDSEEIQRLISYKMVKYTQNMERNSKIIIGYIVESLYKEKQRRELFRKNNIPGLNQVEVHNEKIFEKKFKEYAEKKIYEILKEKKSNFTKNRIEKTSKKRLSNAITLLDKINALKVNNDINNQRLDKLDLGFLKFDYECNEKNNIAIKDLENQEFLNRFDITEISALNAFYVNRLVKKLEEYNLNFYLGRKLDIYNKIMNNEPFNINLSDEEIKYIVLQKDFLKDKAQDIISEVTKKYEKDDSKDEGDFIISKEKIKNSDKFRENVEKYKKEYEKLYNKIYLPSFENNFEKDLITNSLLNVDMYNLYEVKDMSAQALMVSLIDNDKNVNWGYIPEKDEKGRNSIQKGSKYVLIGFDLKGYNMPIKLHFERDRIEKFLDGYTNSTAIPVYEGNEDVEINDEFLTTQVLMKLSKKQRAEIKSSLKNMSPDDERYKYISHLNWMMLPNRYPEHLKKADGTRQPKVKIDIKTGKEYVEKKKEEKDIER